MAGLVEIKQQERETRRRLILAAAQRLFAEKDFRCVTVREIAKTAEVSIGTIYNYYANLDDLLFDVFLKGSEEITERLEVERQRDQPCSLDRLCEIYIEYLNENMTFYQMIGHFMLGGILASGATEKLNLVMRALMERIDAILIAEGVKSETRLHSHALFSALNGIMISYARYPGRSRDEIRSHTKRLARLIARRFKGLGG
ncbi:MAG: TetR/AcrR family transcriptional regulator [Thermodesulfobacteriota bacterium]